MARQMTMSAEVILKIKAAQKGIDEFEKKVRGTKKEFTLFGRTMSLDTARITKNLKALSLISGAFLSAILIMSPATRAELFRLKASLISLSLAFDSVLAPAVAGIVDQLEFAIDAFLRLDSNWQEFIITTIALTVAISGLTLAIVALSAAAGPIALVILGLAAGIAAWLVFNDEITSFGENLVTTAGNIRTAMHDALVAINKSVDDFFSQFGLFGEIIGTIVGGALTIFSAFPIVLTEIFTTSMEIVGDFITALTALFRGDFAGIAEALGNVFIRVVNLLIRTINNFFINPLNSALRAIDNFAETVGGDVNVRLKTIGEIPAFQEGGEVRRDGLIFAHREEEVTSKSQARANRRGDGGEDRGTIIIKNTFNIGSVDSKQRIRQIVRDVERASKRSNDRRFKT